MRAHTSQGINACRAILEGQDQLASIYVNNNGLSAAAAHVREAVDRRISIRSFARNAVTKRRRQATIGEGPTPVHHPPPFPPICVLPTYLQAVVEILTFRTPTNLRVLHFFNNMSGGCAPVSPPLSPPHRPTRPNLTMTIHPPYVYLVYVATTTPPTRPNLTIHPPIRLSVYLSMWQHHRRQQL